jgi:excisionase family DNA binding protein
MTDEELLKKLFLTVNETAQILRVNHKTVRQMLRDGRLAFQQFGRAIRIPTSAVRSMTL